jgi:hypothetical protein
MNRLLLSVVIGAPECWGDCPDGHVCVDAGGQCMCID